jgi:2-dehydropantoate 2-reductase
MKIAVVGCGALGSFYGAKLCRAGHEVRFLLRGDFDTVRRHGVRVRSIDGDFHVHPHCARTAEEIGPCDLVIISLKTTANSEFPRLLPPLAGPHTAVLTLQNGLGNEEALARLLPPAQIMGGLCFVCLNRLEPGLIQHTAHGRIVLGEFSGPPGPRTRDVAGLFRDAGISCDVTENLRRTHWEKLVWNIPFNGLGVASAAGLDAVVSGSSAGLSRPGPCLTTDQLLVDDRWQGVVRALMREVIATANALGLGVDPAMEDDQVNRTRAMGAYRPSTLIDFERGLPLELDSMFIEPLCEAREAGVDTPCLAALCTVLRELDPAGRPGKTRSP